ncbi:MAG: tRNA threonylcarbamoyl adenosine modification protein (Sua5/YciO/YrdC/YwlC family) [Flavobacteriales bacterium]|jgi:tRNA threonylcarbamoyl adenosine modification protein (Sua5/YciO/YrdC/YwlC family)
MLVKLYPENPNEKTVQQVVDCLKNGGVIIYPTDTVYGLGCDITNKKALEKVAKIKGVKLEKANFSFICHDLSHLSEYVKAIDTPTYKLLRRTLPGPYTFILEATNVIAKMFKNNKKTVGIRIPDNTIPRAIVEALGNPLVSTSIHDDDEVLEYSTDPELIHEKYEGLVDMVIDGGYGDNVASTVIDCTLDEFVILREGKGALDVL